MSEPTAALPPTPSAQATPTGRKRPKPGERRVQILQTLAAMLEQPGGERITTAALAARLDVSEAALYRHFASKAQMLEGLLEFIEQSVFGLINQIAERAHGAAVDDEASAADPGAGKRQAAQVIAVLVQFAEKNPGLARVMVGDALVFEAERLQARMGQFFDKIESSLKQMLREGAQSATPSLDAQVLAATLVAFAVGRLQRYVRSGFKRSPSDQLDACLACILG